jgi:hypothetical protein
VTFLFRWHPPWIGFSPITISAVLPIVHIVGAKVVSQTWPSSLQSNYRTMKNYRRCAGSINFGSGIHSMRNVTAWFAAK